jgi:peptidoglycan/LPS O-acetylase OafA/YrhL
VTDIRVTQSGSQMQPVAESSASVGAVVYEAPRAEIGSPGASTNESKPGALPRLPALTGLRILAALAVYASHLGPPHNAPTIVRSLMESGYVGVTLFFVLSGFVLAVNYFDGLRRPSVRKMRDYAVARFARIYPLYILILFYIMVRRHAFGVSLAGWWEHVLALQAWDPHVTQAYNFNGPAWSISVEFFLYACFPILVVMLARLSSVRTLLVAAAIVVLIMTGITTWFAVTGRGGLPWANPESAHRWLYRMPLTRLGDFALGVLAARIYALTRRRAALIKVGGLLALGAALVAVGLMAWDADLFSVWSWDLAYLLPAVLVIFGLAIAPRSLPARALSLPIMVLLGEASYAFYLVHKPAMEYFGADRWAVATSSTTIVYEALTLGAIMCLAVGLHVVVERPARRYIRRLLGPSDDRPKQSPWHGPVEALP